MRWSFVERWLWYLLLVVFTWQTRAIVWQADWPFIEWRSASLYATDLLIMGLWISAWAQGWRLRGLDGADRGALAVACVAVLSLIGADAPVVGLVAVVRAIECALFFIWLRHRALGRFPADASVAALVIGAAGQALIGSAQYALQADLGLRWMGETLLDPSLRGVAVFLDGAGTKVMRAYGVLPHPNILAACLVVALWMLAWLYHRHGHREPLAWWLAGGVLLWGLLATYARTIIAAAVLGGLVVAVLAWRLARRTVLFFLMLGLVVGGLFALTNRARIEARMHIRASDEAVVLRVAYTRDAIHAGGDTGSAVNWLGVGAGNFTTWLAAAQPELPAWRVQPAHNVFLLAYAEIGVVGLIVVLAWIGAVARIGWRSWRHEPLVRLGLACLLGTLIAIALFDHFFWTLQQGRILWYGVLALAAGAAGAYTKHHAE